MVWINSYPEGGAGSCSRRSGRWPTPQYCGHVLGSLHLLLPSTRTNNTDTSPKRVLSWIFMAKTERNTPRSENVLEASTRSSHYYVQNIAMVTKGPDCVLPNCLHLDVSAALDTETEVKDPLIT